MAQNKQINPPNLSAVLGELKTDIFNNMNCINVGIIQSFDEADQTATVRIAIKKVFEIQEDGTRVIQERPLLLKCPVIILFGGSTYMTFPIAAGDECLVLFNDREIDGWWTTGSAQAPQSPRAHSSSDAFALVGVRSLQKSIESYLTTGIRLSHETARLDMTQDQIDTIASEFIHTGNMQVTGNSDVGGNLSVIGTTTVTGETTLEDNASVEGDLEVQGGFTVLGTVTGSGGVFDIDADIIQEAGRSISVGNGATGTFTTVIVEDGIVVGGS